MSTPEQINEMREKVRLYDEACARKIELECQIESLTVDSDRFYMRKIKSLEAAVYDNNGYPHTILSRQVLTVGEVAAALLPVLKAKLWDAEVTLKQL